jgi:PKD repeat protein
VTGIGGQSDGSLPLLDGYTLLPRGLSDLTDPVFSSFEIPDVIVLGGTPVFATNESENADYYQWSFGNGTFSNEEEPELVYTEAGTYNIYLTATDAETQCSDQSSATLVVEAADTVVEAASLELELFPNPARGDVRIQVSEACDFEVRDASGRTLLQGRWAAGSQTLEASAWPQGVYTLIVTGSTREVTRFSLQR